MSLGEAHRWSKIQQQLKAQAAGIAICGAQ